MRERRFKKQEIQLISVTIEKKKEFFVNLFIFTTNSLGNANDFFCCSHIQTQLKSYNSELNSSRGEDTQLNSGITMRKPEYNRIMLNPY